MLIYLIIFITKCKALNFVKWLYKSLCVEFLIYQEIYGKLTKSMYLLLMYLKKKRIKKIKQDISQKIKKNYMIDFSQAVDHTSSYSTVVCFVYSALSLCVEMLLFSLC